MFNYLEKFFKLIFSTLGGWISVSFEKIREKFFENNKYRLAPQE